MIYGLTKKMLWLAYQENGLDELIGTRCANLDKSTAAEHHPDQFPLSIHCSNTPGKAAAIIRTSPVCNLRKNGSVHRGAVSNLRSHRQNERYDMEAPKPNDLEVKNGLEQPTQQNAVCQTP